MKYLISILLILATFSVSVAQRAKPRDAKATQEQKLTRATKNKSGKPVSVKKKVKIAKKQDKAARRKKVLKRKN
ncbi:MAG: hypothetical protein AB7K37_06550 [Cyclobacteriaceae bacterium]